MLDLRRRLAFLIGGYGLLAVGLGLMAYRHLADLDPAMLFSALLGLAAIIAISGFWLFDRWVLQPVTEPAAQSDPPDQPIQATRAPPPGEQEPRVLAAACTELRHRLRTCEQALDHLKHHDPLTGLPNRIRFRSRLASAIEDSDLAQMLIGVMFIDLDRFKQVNDSHGHSTGDQMLVQISERLRRVFRQDDLVARLGGDEFAVLLQNLHERSEMSQLADKALAAIERPYQIDGQRFYSGASIGIAVAPDDSMDPDELIRQADAAMYVAKREAGSSYRYVSDDMTLGAAAQHQFENQLREAVSEHQLKLYFQPVQGANDGRLHCYEALLRWPHAEQGMLRPASFMDTVNDAGLCAEVSDWALDRIQYDRPSGDVAVAINLSARLLHDESFARRLYERLDSGALAADQLILEITEDTLETDLQGATRVLRGLKQRDVRIALDDFGTGQSSLSHLRRFPFDYLKIDQAFVAGVGGAGKDEKLIEAVIRLAHALDMAVVAEGVETEAQRSFLAAAGCD
ncbi:MAG: EAL domain-containing protein, partial [Chromatiaceae bacterium]